MGTSWGRRLAGVSLVGVLAIATACAPDPGPAPGGPGDTSWSGTFTSSPGNLGFTTGELCVDDATTFRVTITGNAETVRVAPVGADVFTTRYAYADGGSVNFDAEPGCHALEIGYAASLLGLPPVGGTFSWFVETPSPALPLSSPLDAKIGRQGGLYQATEYSNRICAPVGTPVKIEFLSPDAAAMTKLWYDDSTGIADALPVTTGHPVTLTSTQGCFMVFVSIASFVGLDDTVYDYRVTWPADPAPPTHYSGRIVEPSTVGAKGVLWESPAVCAPLGTRIDVTIDGLAPTIVALTRWRDGVNSADGGWQISVMPWLGGTRSLRTDAHCFSVVLVDSSFVTSPALDFEFEVTWPGTPVVSGHQNELYGGTGNTDLVCATSPGATVQVDLDGVDAPYQVVAMRPWGPDEPIQYDAETTSFSVSTGSQSCVRLAFMRNTDFVNTGAIWQATMTW